MLKKGLVHIYTGNGKGKTTAALGLALRAAGNGLKVFIGQFAKGRAYGELKALKNIRNIRIEQFGRNCFIRRGPEKIDIELAKKGLKKIEAVLVCREYDMVILDEVNIAVYLGLLKAADVLKVVKKSPAGIEIILTGRGAPPSLIRAADYVSEIKDIKHPYHKGVTARKGIEY